MVVVTYAKSLLAVSGPTGDLHGEVTDAAIEYWDYSRLTDIEGVETEEFIFVEMNKADGWFEIWRGIEVAAGKIAVV